MMKTSSTMRQAKVGRRDGFRSRLQSLTCGLAIACLLLALTGDDLSIVKPVDGQLEAIGAFMSVVPVTSILTTAGIVGVKMAALSRLLEALGYDQAYLAKGGAGTAAQPIGLQTKYAYMFPYVPGLNISVKGEHGTEFHNDAAHQREAWEHAETRKTYPAMGLPGDYEHQSRPFRGSDTLRDIFKSAGIKMHVPQPQQSMGHQKGEAELPPPASKTVQQSTGPQTQQQALPVGLATSSLPYEPSFDQGLLQSMVNNDVGGQSAQQPNNLNTINYSSTSSSSSSHSNLFSNNAPPPSSSASLLPPPPQHHQQHHQQQQQPAPPQQQHQSIAQQPAAAQSSVQPSSSSSPPLEQQGHQVHHPQTHLVQQAHHQQQQQPQQQQQHQSTQVNMPQPNSHSSNNQLPPPQQNHPPVITGQLSFASAAGRESGQPAVGNFDEFHPIPQHEIYRQIWLAERQRQLQQQQQQQWARDRELEAAAHSRQEQTRPPSLIHGAIEPEPFDFDEFARPFSQAPPLTASRPAPWHRHPQTATAAAAASHVGPSANEFSTNFIPFSYDNSPPIYDELDHTEFNLVNRRRKRRDLTLQQIPEPEPEGRKSATASSGSQQLSLGDKLRAAVGNVQQPYPSHTGNSRSGQTFGMPAQNIISLKRRRRKRSLFSSKILKYV